MRAPAIGPHACVPQVCLHGPHAGGTWDVMQACGCMCRLKGLSAEDMLVYQHIQASGNTGAHAHLWL